MVKKWNVVNSITTGISIIIFLIVFYFTFLLIAWLIISPYVSKKCNILVENSEYEQFTLQVCKRIMSESYIWPINVTFLIITIVIIFCIIFFSATKFKNKTSQT